jgi:hypothetical protein
VVSVIVAWTRTATMDFMQVNAMIALAILLVFASPTTAA